MKVLVTGARGQLAQEFIKLLEKKNIDFIALSKERLDISKYQDVKDAVKAFSPSVIINCGAYNYVDQAEKEKERAFRINALGIRNLAYICAQKKIFLIHYSTDYVFDGMKQDGLYTESDIPSPISVYGESKLLGEIWLKQEMHENYLIFRISWLYGHGKKNFIYKLLQWTKTQEFIKISCDEFSIPTSAITVANVSWEALEKGATGLFHLTNSGYCSRFEWARSILNILNIKKFIKPVYMHEFNLPAKRPLFSAMDNSKISKFLAIEIKDWYTALKEFLINFK